MLLQMLTKQGIKKKNSLDSKKWFLKPIFLYFTIIFRHTEQLEAEERQDEDKHRGSKH